MSPRRTFGSRPNDAVFLALAILVIIFFLPAVLHFAGKHEINHFVEQIASLYPIEERTARLSIPSGTEEYSHNFSTTAQHFARVKRAIDFDHLVCTGEKLLDLILSAQPKDQFKPEDLQNGWTRKENVNPVAPDELEHVLNQLRIPQGRADIKPAYYNQDKEFTDLGNHKMPPTGGYYHNMIIPAGHAIIAAEIYSPKLKAPGKPFPQLHRWSDVTWLCWLAEAGHEAGNLKYIIRSNIVTQSTRDVLEYIHGARQDDMQLPWPGVTYDPQTTREGKAILATSHGRGIAYLIADHSDVLGRKTPVARVFTVSSEEVYEDEDMDDGSDFDDNSFLYYYILWELHDAGNAPAQRPLRAML
ncbi:MAG: hypothetical protein Q9213_005990 [Squamulea squamosa]